MLNYRLITPPTTEPVTLEQSKNSLRVDFDSDDALISMLISVAREYCEQIMQRSIYNQTFRMTLDQFPYGDFRSTRPVAERFPYQYSGIWNTMAIQLPMPRLVSVTSITYTDQTGAPQTLDPSTYYVDPNSEPARIVPVWGNTWPLTNFYLPGSIAITFQSGSFGDGVTVDNCPASIRMAILLMVGHLYENREATSQPALTSIPLGVDALLSPYRFFGWFR